MTDHRRMVPTSTPGIYKRGGGYTVVFRDGSGRQRKRAARTLAEARALKSSLTTDVARGEFRELSRITFADYAAGWLDTYAGRTAGGIRETTRSEYRRAIEQRAVPYFGRRRLAEIEPMHVKAYLASVQAERRPGREGKPGRPVSRDTVRLAFAPVRALFATALEEGLIRSNPCAGIRIPRPETVDDEGAVEQVKALTEDELKALIANVAKDWQLLVRFLAETGLRIGEALALSWEHVDFGRRRVLVRRRVYEGKFGPPKSRYGRRDVPLSKGMAQALWRARGAAADGELVFQAKGGGLVHPSSALRAVKAAAKAAKLGDWPGLHTLRHSCATALFRRGWNAKQVQLMLGHHSPAFTLATYVHLLPDDLPESPFEGVLVAVEGGNTVGTQPTETGRSEPAEAATVSA